MDKKYRIILASGSPRRQQFFRDFAIDFEIHLREVDEVYPPQLSGAEITEFLARLKADAFDDLDQNDILITSDTIVWHRGIAVGKPKNQEDAFEILRRLSDETHEVITSVCFRTHSGEHVLTDITKVRFGHITDDQIKYYIDHYQPFDKAGAYGIQDWIGIVAVESIEGSYTNVMGLPTQKVFAYLNTFGQ